MKGFRNVAIVIIVSLSLLFVFNIFYLKGLFDSVEADTKRVVFSCIAEADSKEVQARLDTLARYKKRERTIVVTPSRNYDNKYSIENKKDDIALNQLLKEVRLLIHHTIDTLLPIDLPMLNRLLVQELKSKGVLSSVYYSEMIDLRNDSVLLSSPSKAVSPPHSYPFLYTYDQENKYAYKIYLSSLTSVVLQQMSGILISTFLIILLLGLAFWYFIRTIMKQKTLEEMKDDFTNNMTHELKTPIAVAYSAADTLLNFKQGDNREKREKYLQICIEQLTHLSGLVEKILSMSLEKRKAILLNKEQVALQPIIQQLTAYYQLKSNKPVHLNVSIHPAELSVYADPVHLSNVISNLLDNAIKYSPDEVQITIEAYRKDKSCVITLKDQGVGMTPEAQEHIFDKFYRVPHGNLHNVKGYGLGLFYVKQIIEKHQGTITVASTHQKGSTFTLTIPAQ
ncbi:MAG: HAMP domain-containing sensor histidine kinase [Tannerellaceae bacterium]